MKIVRFGIGAATCVALSACAGVLHEQKSEEGCYPVDTLSARQRTALHVGSGNPIFLVGGKKIVCSCYESGSLAGGGEGGHLAGGGEEGRLAGTGEEGHLAGGGEEGRLAGTGEEGHLAGGGEEGRLAGTGEEGHLAGGGEEGRLAGTGEEGRLAGTGEEGRLAGNFSKLSCRIVPECPGFQVTGYAPKQIEILTKTGQKKSVPTSCVTWW